MMTPTSVSSTAPRALPAGSRLAFVLPSLKMGGAEQVVRLLAQTLLKRHTVLVIAVFGGGPLVAQFQADGIPLVVLEGQRSWRRPWHWLWALGRTCWQLRQILHCFKPDIVNAHSLGHTAEVWLATRRLGAAATVLTLHNTYPLFAARSWMARLRRNWLRGLFGRFDALIAISDEVRAWAVQHDMAAPTALHVVTNGIDTHRPSGSESRAQLRARHCYPDDKLIFIKVASLLPKKAHRDLLSAIAQSNEALRRQALFLLVGDGPERPALLAQCEQLRLGDCVRFLGIRHDVPELLALSDVMVVASHHEGLSLALMEGMLAGLPAISTRVPGSTLLIREEVNGFLTPPGDSAALSRRLEWCLAHRDELPALGAAARATISDYFSAGRMAADTEAVLAQAWRGRQL